MTSATLTQTVPIQERLDAAIDSLLRSLPNPEQLSPMERRGIIARYTAVLEGNFIYWMTGTYLSVRSNVARDLILENLREEVRDCHPHMLRKFAMAADAVPTDSDMLAVGQKLLAVRLFIGRLSPISIVVMMAFFEGFIQRFMPYLAVLAQKQGSEEQEYTEVHGVCDITHSQELYRALKSEMLLADDSQSGFDLFEGVDLLRALIKKVIAG